MDARRWKRPERFRPQLALLDVGMPHLDGYEVARRIRASGWGRDMVLIAVTGWGQARDRELAREAGFDEHFTKPLDPDQLALKLQGLQPQAGGDRALAETQDAPARGLSCARRARLPRQDFPCPRMSDTMCAVADCCSANDA